LKYIRDLQATLSAYEPKTEAQKTVHAATVTEFNEMAKLGRQRLQSVKTGLPAALWWVVILGAFINILLVWLLVIEDIRVHIILSLMMTLTMGLLIFLTAAMDNPYRGEFSISTDSFVEIYEQLTKKSS
jgi:ABC-type branched-subunit amino acid transport system permease subunit